MIFLSRWVINALKYPGNYNQVNSADITVFAGNTPAPPNIPKAFDGWSALL